ncbi:MAG: DUF2600 family protein [Solirubrobacteraceae bacterium]
MAKAGFALVLANMRYWSTVAPLVREQLVRWERHARTIPDPFLRAQAIRKLSEERFNAEVAATLATLARPIYRRSAVEAIVALQVAYDYMDLLGEQLRTEAPAESRHMLGALIDALTQGEQLNRDYYHYHPNSQDGGYLRELVGAVRHALAKLPATGAIEGVAIRSAERCAEAQAISNTAPCSEMPDLERWAKHRATGTGLQWPDFLAGAAASVLAIHALIAAAADPETTHQDAERIDAAYLSICALTMLDSVVDHEHDIATGELSYVELYGSHELMALRLASLARDATDKARRLPHAAHHIMTLIGVVAYYASALNAGSPATLPVTASVSEELRPLLTPTLAVMRAWRRAKRARAWLEGTRCIV